MGGGLESKINEGGEFQEFPVAAAASPIPSNPRLSAYLLVDGWMDGWIYACMSANDANFGILSFHRRRAAMFAMLLNKSLHDHQCMHHHMKSQRDGLELLQPF